MSMVGLALSASSSASVPTRDKAEDGAKMRSISCTNFEGRRAMLRRWVRDEILAAFDGRSERETCERAAMALGIAPGTVRAHLRCEVQKPDVAIALICRAHRGAQASGRIFETIMGAA